LASSAALGPHAAAPLVAGGLDVVRLAGGVVPPGGVVSVDPVADPVAGVVRCVAPAVPPAHAASSSPRAAKPTAARTPRTS
jgi:hypothetical protein